MLNRRRTLLIAALVATTLAVAAIITASRADAPDPRPGTGDGNGQGVSTATPSLGDIETYAAKSPDESAIVETLKSFQSAYQGAGIETIAPILLPTFEYAYVFDLDHVATDTPQAYVAARQWWKGAEAERRLDYAIAGIDFFGDSKTRILATVLSTYHTKYFAPRFLEVYAFEKHGERWLLRRQTATPLSPAEPTEGDAQIFVTGARYGSRAFHSAFQQATTAHGPDYLIDEFRREEIGSVLPEDEVYRSVLFVFKETPPVGTTITTEHQWKVGAKEYNPAVYTYTIDRALPFYVIENKTASGGQGNGTLTWRVKVNGEVVAEKAVDRQTVTGQPARRLTNGAYLPLDVAVTPPAENVPERHAAFSGLWAGTWNGTLASAIAIEEVSASGNVVLAFGLADDLRNWGAKEATTWNVPRRWERLEGTIAKDGTLVLFDEADARLSLTVSANHDLHGVFVGEDGQRWEAMFSRTK